MKKLYATTLAADLTVMTAEGFKTIPGFATTVTIVTNVPDAGEAYAGAHAAASASAKEHFPEADGWFNHRVQFCEIPDQTLASYLFA